MGKWEKLKEYLQNDIEEKKKMSFYEFHYSKHIGPKEVLEKMSELEKNG